MLGLRTRTNPARPKLSITNSMSMRLHKNSTKWFYRNTSFTLTVNISPLIGYPIATRVYGGTRPIIGVPLHRLHTSTLTRDNKKTMHLPPLPPRMKPAEQSQKKTFNILLPDERDIKKNENLQLKQEQNTYSSNKENQSKKKESEKSSSKSSSAGKTAAKSNTSGKAARKQQSETKVNLVLDAADDWDITRCSGCGVRLQTTDPLRTGYVPPHIYEEYKRFREELPYKAIPMDLSAAGSKTPPKKDNSKVEASENSINPSINELQQVAEQFGIDVDLKSGVDSILDFQMGDLELDDTEDAENLEQQEETEAAEEQLEDEEALKLRWEAPSDADILETPQTETVRERIICQRCHHLQHSGKVVPAAMSPEDFAELLKPLRDSRSLIVSVVDIFDFNGSVIPSLRKYSGSNPVLLLGNKVDLLPDGVHLARVKAWLHKEAKKYNLGNVVNVLLMSCRTGEGMDDVVKAIEWYRRDRDAVFIMGVANVGKSTFINRLIDKFRGPKDRKLTVSTVPGTTLGLVRFPLGESAFLYDTPGLISRAQISTLLTPEEIKAILPTKRIKPVVYRISPGTTIFIGGLARFDYLDGPPLVFFTFFTANTIYLHKTSTKNADQIYAKHLRRVLTPPTPNNTTYPPLQPRTLTLENPNGSWDRAHADIVLGGLGWISVTQRGTVTVKVWYPEQCGVFVRDPLMPFESKRGLLPNPRYHIKPVGKGIIPSPLDDDEEEQDNQA